MLARMSLPRALTIAGSDSGGGAGVQADLKTFQELDCFGTSVLTALTAQDTVGVHAVHEVPPSFVRAQLDAVCGDIGVDAAKVGMLSSAPIAEAVAEGLRAHGVERLVVDPACVSKHGDPLLRDDALGALKAAVLPLAEVVTPNLEEVRRLTGVEVRGVADLRVAAEALHALGPRWVLVKGGHLPDAEDAVDLLFDGEREVRISSRRLESRDTHGTGCTLSAAIAAHRARGLGVEDAVRAAKEFVTGAIAHGLRLGRGIGPLDHGWRRR
jgi:hydroxymethylpyrimidine/phosphomethylpyrimidine kinase